MNKQDLIDALAQKTQLNKADCGATLDAFIDVVTETLAKKEPVALVGFGTFSVKERDARAGRNPQTGESITIAAKTVPTFKSGKGLNDACNKI